MEINITEYVENAEMFDFSASVAERGRNAGPETWVNAKAEAERNQMLAADQLPAFRDYMRGFGAWDDTEIDSWDATECNALFIQLVAGDMREAESLCPGDGPASIDWAEHEKLAERGTIAGRMYCVGDQVFYYVGD